MEELIFVTLLLILGASAYYSMVLLPRQREFQKRQRTAQTLKVGDEVITGGGVIGKVQRVDADQGITYIEIAEGITIRLVTAAILRPFDPEEIASNARMGQEQAEAPTS
jgi:preprotein translocase subunit YajC